ncbi:Fructose-1,6-bisphosphatase class 1 [Frankliniella fusca]|uniref:Fructose-1,6-bisphosphatase class 1 n=1 Tax=Frankliniella fusca TaxID=407009 RepID=A0AAE1GV85_9NEOP|nr:Fructose-1,6-bisphosphatase class 1 [Frankliniella fusca]KAK3910866.1 Fructose-1,6-bisphosphatase class 1 [Frankliniella fusca]
MYRKEGHGAVKYQRSPALTSFNINRCIRQLQVLLFSWTASVWSSLQAKLAHKDADDEMSDSSKSNGCEGLLTQATPKNLMLGSDLLVYPKEDTSDSESIIEDVESGHIVELVLVHDEMQGCNVFTLSSHNICSAQWLLQK